MATKFASIYKQELKSKGALSSMGSAVLKSARERMDVRNIFFGGKGMLSATGQKIFGRGYSALSSGAMPTPSNSQAAAQSAATGELISSNERQEALLRVVAKNTFNMNMMARDMNITRQNIATMTRVMAGRASQSQDAMWYDVKTRNQAIDSLGKKETRPTKKSETKSSDGGIFSGIASGITSVIGSVVGVLGGIGGGILSALSIVARLSPILAIVGVMASAYVIKELGKAVDFNAIGEAIAKFLGIDTKSEKGFFQQILEKLDKKFETTFFTDTKKNIETFYTDTSNLIIRNFGPQINAVGKGIAVAVDIATVYTKAAFQTLADGFSGIGKAIIFLYSEYFQSNKGAILGAIAVGLAARFGPKAAAVAGAAMVGYGGITGEKSREERKIELDKLTKEYAEEQERISVEEANDKTGVMRNRIMLKREAQRKKLEEIIQKQAQLEALEAEFRGFLTPDSDRFDKYLREGKAALPGGEFGGGYKPIISEERMSQARTGTAPTPVKKGDLVHGRYPVTSPHGERENPFDRTKIQMHHGADVALPPGYPLKAVVDGVVIGVGENDIAGNFVSIRDADGNIYSYSHLESVNVKKDATVKRGDLIGRSGSTGRSTAPHLHFDVKDKQGNYRSPTLQELQNAIPEKISQLTFDNQNLRASLASSGGDTFVDNRVNTNNNYSAPSAGDSLASVLNMDLMEIYG